jgi:hypothetical protein
MNENARMQRRTFLALAGSAVAGVGTTAAAEAGWRVTAMPLDVKAPSALAVGPDGAIWVAGEDAIVVLGPEGGERSRFAVTGRPGCLAVAAENRVLAGMRGHVEVFKSDGTKMGEWPDLGERAWLTSIACDDDNVYVADAGNRIVWRFDPSGKLVNKIGEKLNVPSPYFDVAINPIGELWVVNPGMHGLENYRPSGDLASSWYRPGIEPGAFCGCCNPIHIAFRADNSLVTAEKGVDRIKIYAPDMSLLDVVVGPADAPAQNNMALGCNIEAAVADLAVDSKNRILVLNKSEKAILVYEQRP